MNTGTGATRTICSASLPTSNHAHTVPAVRAEDDDQVGLEGLRLLGDDIADPARLQLRQVGRDLHAGGGGVLLHLLQDLLAHFPVEAEHVAGVGFAAGEDDAVEHVDQADGPSALLREADGLVEAVDGGGTAVNGHEDALVHGRLQGWSEA